MVGRHNDFNIKLLNNLLIKNMTFSDFYSITPNFEPSTSKKFTLIATPSHFLDTYLV